VRGAYRSGITDGKPDFSRKHDHYSGSLDRSALLAALDQQHIALAEALRTVTTDDPAKTVDFAGRPSSLLEYTYVIIQHEGVHFGEWSLYASLAGFEPRLTGASSGASRNACSEVDCWSSAGGAVRAGE
jgi:hypothetical protein